MTDWTCATCPVSSWVHELMTMAFQTHTGYRHTIRYCGIHNTTAAERTMTNYLDMYFVSDSRLSLQGFGMLYRGIESKFISAQISNDLSIEYKENENHACCPWLSKITPTYCMNMYNCLFKGLIFFHHVFL